MKKRRVNLKSRGGRSRGGRGTGRRGILPRKATTVKSTTQSTQSNSKKRRGRGAKSLPVTHVRQGVQDEPTGSSQVTMQPGDDGDFINVEILDFDLLEEAEGNGLLLCIHFATLSE